MRKKKQVLLSSFLKEQHPLKRTTVELTGKEITQIDEISPFLSSEIQSLNLSNNKISNLANISQFTLLKQLDISNNKISDCNQLQHLRRLVHLKKLYFSNNPFLNQPIEEPLLDLILEKETDIEILSLELIKEVESDQIKIIFLKNYLNKIELHEELKQKQYIRSCKHTLNTEQLVDKIIPQFYTAIEDPKIINKIKQEALTLKKQHKNSLEEALTTSKALKEEKIDQLLKSIVQLMQESNSFTEQKTFLLEVNFNDNTITFSPEKRGKKQFKNSVRIEEEDEEEFSPVKYIELSKDQNTFEEITINNAKSTPMTEKPSFSPTPPPKPQLPHGFDALETIRKNNTGICKPSVRFSSFAEFKQNLQNKKQSQHKSKETEKTQIKIEYQKQINLKLKTPECRPKRKTPEPESKTDYIRVVEAKESSPPKTKEKSNKKELKPIAIQMSPLLSPKNGNESNISWRNNLQSTQQLSPENIEIIYYKTMTKMHPMFNLLHSPSASLKEEEKNTILQALKSHNKDTFIELLKEKFNSQTLSKQLQQLRSQSALLVKQNEEIGQQNNRFQEQYNWIDNRYRVLQSDYSQMHCKLKQLQALDKSKNISIANMQTSYKKIKNSYTEKAEELQRLQTAQENEEILQEKHQILLKKAILNNIQTKAHLWSIILDKQRKANQQTIKELYQWGISSFKKNRILQLAVKRKQSQKQAILVKQKFKEWKEEVQIVKKQKLLSTRRRLKFIHLFLELLQKNQASAKQIKLKQIWATRFYQKKQYQIHYVIWKQLYLRRRVQGQKAKQQWISKTWSTYFNAIKQLMQKRQSNILQISSRLEQKCRSRQFQRLSYLIKKQILQNKQKQTKVRLSLQHCARKTTFLKFKTTALILQRKKVNKQKASKHLLKKTFNTLKQQFKKTFKRLGQLQKLFSTIRSNVIYKSLKRQKKSDLLSLRLLAHQMTYFLSNLKQNKNKRKNLRNSNSQITAVKKHKAKILQLKFIKTLQIGRLKGKNYIKNRAIKQMNFQMDLSDQRALELIREGQQSLQRCEKQIVFLKGQIQTQSNRQMALMAENDSLRLASAQSFQIMQQLRKQFELMKQQSHFQDLKYNELAKKYNQVIFHLHKNKKDQSEIKQTKN